MTDAVSNDLPVAVVDPTPLSDDGVLEYTQGLRKRVVDELTREGIPKDLEITGIVLKTLDGMDRQALTRMKIKSDENANDNSERLAASVIAEVFSKLKGKSPYQRDAIEGEFTVPPPTPDLNKLPALTMVPGETDIGTSDMTYDTFMANQGKKSPQSQEEDFPEA